ncbi:MAG: DUF4385 domain-containing protein [Thermomicrobiales bacterium]|nr:DUF4385 domain-containing protein [Thermomicrobiales bacterium]
MAKEKAGFDYGLDYGAIDIRERPELYRVGRGEQGVLLVEPYKSELLPLWRFRTPEVARESAEALTEWFEAYRRAGDFVGMDMARKFLQMGWTRARRYANHKGGRKYAADGSELPRGHDPEKAEAARIFYDRYVTVRDDPEYARLREEWVARYG